MNITAQTSQNRMKGKKGSLAPSACSIQEDQQNSLGRFKGSRRALFSPKCETVRPGAVKGPKTDPEIRRLTPTTEKLRQISLCYPTELAFYFLFLLLFVLLFLFILLFFYFSSFSLVFCVLFV